MKKNLSIVCAVFCLVMLFVSCNGLKKQNSKITFDLKVYEDESPWGPSLFFVDADFCLAGLACCNYSFDKKTNELTVTTFAALGSETEKYVYNSEEDTFTDSNGNVLKFTRLMEDEEIETANALKKLTSRN